MAATSFRVSWNRFPSHVLSALDSLRLDEDFVDVSIYCGRKLIKAHRNVLSASSSYFKEIFKANPSSHPVVILCDVDYLSLRTLVDFMYHGEIEVPTAMLDELLRLGEMLQVQGISSSKGVTSDEPRCAVPAAPAPEPPLSPGDVIPPECVITEPTGRGAAVALRKRRRRSRRRDSGSGHAAPARDHVTAAGGRANLPGDGVASTVGHLAEVAALAAPARVPEPPTPAHLDTAAGHVTPAVSHVTPDDGPLALLAAPPEPTALPALGALKTERPDDAEHEPGVPPPAPPESADSGLLLLDDSEQPSGLDMTQYSGGMFAGSLGSRRPLTGAERARRYRERKKLKKLYETLLGGSPKREQLAVQL